MTNEKKEKFTPGMSIQFHNGNFYIQEDGVNICKMNTHGNIPTTMRTAKMFCASRKMLTALQSLMLHFNRTEIAGGTNTNYVPAKVDRTFAAVRQAEDAISKTLGE